jgi:nitroreductase
MANQFKEKGKIKIAIDVIRTFWEYYLDALYYKRYSMLMNKSPKNYEYQILLRLHGLEKGICMPDSRKFGQEKIEVLIDIMSKAKIIGEVTTGYLMAEGIIREWIELFEKNHWTDDPVYQKVKLNYNEIVSDDAIDSGIIRINKEQILEKVNGNFSDLCYSRHSTRRYSSVPLKNSDIDECISLAKMSPSACNRQMCKIYWIESEQLRSVMESIGLGLSGFSKETANYLVITFDMKAFNYYGERDQGYFNAGLFVMNFTYALHYKGIGSCCLQWGQAHSVEKKIKNILNIPQDEKIAVVLAAGYYDDENIVPLSHRRDNEEILYRR